MKVQINKLGMMTVSAENGLEAYALKHWVDQALVMQSDEKRQEDCHWRGSLLAIEDYVEKNDA